MNRFVTAAALAASLLLAACANGDGPPGTPYSEVAATIPPVPAGEARIYFYRDYEPYESLARPWIYLNGRRIGYSDPGGVYYRDVAPGTYRIKVDSEGRYWHQFKTVTLAPGNVVYAKIESLRSWDSGDQYQRDTFVVDLIGPPAAERQIAALNYVSGG
ncbi:MAG TPA: DUF2846 domain-containing protein [Stellaceae bacterium]|nr:DUF2846 domain-containing protein [Stellaceae bacterium]